MPPSPLPESSSKGFVPPNDFRFRDPNFEEEPLEKKAMPLENESLSQATDLSDVGNAGIRQVGFNREKVDVLPEKTGFQLHQELKTDARLYDLCFVGPNGWAVGDHGAIWRTADGGQSWIPQESTVDCPLRSVCFVDENNGIIVGGFARTFTQNGDGVVLRTQDGGKSWFRIPTVLPPLYKVQLTDRSNGWAAGCSSESAPSGLFRTKNAGREWEAVRGKKNEGWDELRFFDEGNGIGIGQNGSLQSVRGTPGAKIGKLPFSTGIRKPKVLDFFPPQNGLPFNGWLVGDGGLLLGTNNFGEHWQIISGKLPEETMPLFDFNAVFGRGNDVWIAGSPGTYIFHSHDAGRSWERAPTGTTVPIRAVRFLDPQTGFAVGDLGTILATRDGGRSWNVQLRGGSRAALLGVFAKEEDIPFEMLVQLCAESGYLGAVELPLQSEDHAQEEGGLSRRDRVHEAVVRCGGSGCSSSWGFPLEKSELNMPIEKIIERLEKENDGQGLRRFRQNLVKMIRIWKPNLLVSTDPGLSEDAARRFLSAELQEAVRAAADPTIFPEQLTEAGLEPWAVDKYYLKLENGQSGEVNIKSNDLAVRIGRPIDEMSFLARGLIEPERSDRTVSVGFRPVVNRFQTASNGRNDLMSGIVLKPGGEARRIPMGTAVEEYETVRQRMVRRNQALGLLEKLANETTSAGKTRSNVNFASGSREFVRNLDADAGAQILWEMGRRYWVNGDWESAEETFKSMIESYPQHTLTAKAYVWLIRFYSGEETLWRLARENQLSNNEELASVITTVSQTDPNGGADKQRSSRMRADGRNLSGVDKQHLLRKNQLPSYADLLTQYFPEISNEPKVRFALAANQRREAYSAEAKKFYFSRSVFPGEELWARRAKAEYWLLTPDKSQLPPEYRECPLPHVVAGFAKERPYLDGHFDDMLDKKTWHAASIFPLTPQKLKADRGPGDLLADSQLNPTGEITLASVSADHLKNMPLTGKASSGNRPGATKAEQNRLRSQLFGTQTMFLYDRQCLYIGLRCRKADGFAYGPIDQAPRPRDPDLSKEDRVEILIDIDRDYGTYYKLTLDYRGWVSDECWGDKNWNPAWFVAREEDEEHWLIEAAIPLESLSETFPKSQDVWCIGLRRIVPGVGIECWNAENSDNLTEGFGYLVFE